MPISKLSSRRRLPRIGKIFLGIKIRKTCGQCSGKKIINNKKCSKCLGEGFIEYPKEVEHFVIDKRPEIIEFYGNTPTELQIMFPIDDNEIIFSQYYKRYGYGILRCMGDGNRATCWDEEHGGIKEIDCPCEHLETDACKPVAILQFILLRPERGTFIPIGSGTYQISTSSKNSIVDVNSGLDYIRVICGRADMIPLILRRAPLETQRVEILAKEKKFKLKKARHFTLQFAFDKMNLIKLQTLALKKPSQALLLEQPDHTEVPEEIFPKHGFISEEEAKKIEAQAAEEEKIKAEESKRAKEEEKKEEIPKEKTEESDKEEGGPEIDWPKDKEPDTGEKTFNTMKDQEKDAITLDNLRNSLDRQLVRLADTGGGTDSDEEKQIADLNDKPTVIGYTQLINHFIDRIRKIEKLKSIDKGE